MAIRLTAEERSFFTRVADTIYTNPFSIGRPEIKARFPGLDGWEAEGREHLFGVLAPAVEGFLAALEARGFRRLQQLTEPEQGIVRHALLFRTYSRYVGYLDAHIEAQLQAPDAPIPAPFAKAALGELAGVGFSPEEGGRYFGLFFQLRRAFYFIDRALVGPSACMAELRRALWNAVFTEDARVYDTYLWNRMEDFSTLLLGETGTGKGAAAAAVGRSGFIPFEAKAGRFAETFTRTFTATNLSQFPETLIESELFGHRKGAFTGAIDHHKGLLERSSAHGSLFLDEIGEVSTEVQIKVLKVLQERTYTPVGSHEERRFAGRVIAATNRTLEALRARGFREDFYYRLSSQVITVPPLRQRLAESSAELPQLAELLVTRTVGRPSPALTKRVLSTIGRDVPPDYAWPGNVRELEQLIRRVLLTQSCRIERPEAAPGAALATELEGGGLTAQELLGRYCALLHSRLGTYEEVARRTGLDRRTVKKYVQAGAAGLPKAQGGRPAR